jgi:exoribonuclease-2
MRPKEDPVQRATLQRIARRVMLERGLAPDYLPAATAMLASIRGPADTHEAGLRDLTGLLWCSIDNDDSRDLDQLSVAESLPGGAVRILVAIADVDSLVPRDSAIDQHAAENTTSVYTAGGVFPMLPERLSTDLTSLGPGVERAAIVVEMVFGPDGVIRDSGVFRAAVRNRAKLAYNSVAAWLAGSGPMPAAAASVPGLGENLGVQHALAESLRARRHEQGALSLETVEAHPVFDGDSLRGLVSEQTNAAKSLIEELMVASNGVTARFLESRGFPSVRRVVRTPSKWDRIVEVAAGKGASLPGRPDGRALERFLLSEERRNPAGFPDLSLCIIKLLGRGEYAVEVPGRRTEGHFGLAVEDYSHSTAPNRRFPDILIQRLLKAALAGAGPPYTADELAGLAQHCTEQEQAAKKVERQLLKSAGAMLLCDRIGQEFQAAVTGAADKGTWIRLLAPPVEGRLVRGFEGMKVGDQLRVRLVHTDVERGYIDFTSAG